MAKVKNIFNIEFEEEDIQNMQYLIVKASPNCLKSA